MFPRTTPHHPHDAGRRIPTAPRNQPGGCLTMFLWGLAGAIAFWFAVLYFIPRWVL